MLKLIKTILLAHTIGFCSSSYAAVNGKLLIVGGALSADNAAIYKALINGLPNTQSKLAIVPAASGKPASYAKKFADDLQRYGLPRDRVLVLPVATLDDPTTKNVDESQWRNNANNLQKLPALTDVGGFWFLGGDQMRIIETLRPHAEQPSALLKIIQQKLTQGAIVGGTSAGAAMMSDPMIAAGDSISALQLPPAKHYSGMEQQEYGALYLHHGLGFFSNGIVDQHFDRKGRLGRLVRTLHETAVTKNMRNKGFGVDEDTAMLVDYASNTFTVLGAGNVVTLNSKDAAFKSQPFAAKNLSLAVFASGDKVDLDSLQLLNAETNSRTVGREYANSPPYQGGGLGIGNARLDQTLGYDLLDNAASKELRRYTFLEDGSSWIYRFRETANSQGYWRYRSGTRDQYSITNVMFDIEPLTLPKLESTAKSMQ
jgi:cyanophycinase